MRTQKVKSKIADEVRISKNLVQFFREVHQLIEERHELVTTSSDDLIQAEFAYGGLMEDGGDRFSFTYFAGEGTEPSWDFDLSASDIAAIATGKQKTLRLWRCHTPGCGYRFGTADATCIDCDYTDDERDSKATVMESLRRCRSERIGFASICTTSPMPTSWRLSATTIQTRSCPSVGDRFRSWRCRRLCRGCEMMSDSMTVRPSAP